MYSLQWSRMALVLLALSSFRFGKAEQYYNDGDGDDAAVVEEYVNEYNSKYDSNADYVDGNGEIVYWTELAILPKRCITYNDVDVILYSLFENGYKQCTDGALGTYVSPVPTFLQGYLSQKEQDAEDQGQDYDYPEAAQYIACTAYQIDGKEYYFQLGCSGESNLAVEVKIYEDSACSKPSSIESSVATDIDVSSIQPQFKQCTMCVHWFDRNDDQPEVDDAFYEERKTNSPLCAVPWSSKEVCDSKCQHIGMEKKQREGFNASDHVLLGILVTFGLVMVGLIMRKRHQMTNKDTLLEQAALSASGLQQPHVVCLFVLIVLVIAVFALLGLKNVTWTLLLIIDSVLFAYLMKLTIASSMNAPETIIGPDGTIFRNDSDDSSVGSNGGGRDGTYNLPVID